MSKRVSELEGAELDYWVAKAEGAVDNGCGDWIFYEGSRCGHEQIDQDLFRPSASWNCGGPIIEKAQINVVRCNDLYFPSGNEHGEYYEQYWRAEIQGNTDLDMPLYREYGPTPLIAAMRAFVASKLGDTVEEIDK